MKDRRELALKELQEARKHFEKIFDILDREEEIFELETYYGTLEQNSNRATQERRSQSKS